MGIVNNLKWRYATKRFDPSKKVSEKDIDYLKQAISLIPSSNGLQPYKVLIITNKDIRDRLRDVSWGQPQISEASHIFLFCNFTRLEPEKVDAFIKLGAEINGYPPEASKEYADNLKIQIASKTPEQLSNWTAKQAYIALGALISAASELKIDTCPMEGFLPVEYDKILGLKEQGLTAAVICAVGYRSHEDSNQYLKKVRKPLGDLIGRLE